jgi:hypothetical protein
MKKASKGVIVKLNGTQAVQTTPGSKGTKSGVNPKVNAQGKPKGKKLFSSSTAPKDAIPQAKYGMTMKSKMKMGGSKKSC